MSDTSPLQSLTIEPTDLRGFQRDLLRAISECEDSPKGLDIRERVEEMCDESMTHARVYENLDQMVECGLLEKGEKDHRTNYYKLTEGGKDMISAFASHWYLAEREME